jgi:hyperosmotically inducible protein
MMAAGVAALAVAMMLGGPVVSRADTSDTWITTKAKMALLTTECVSAPGVNVDTVDGRVTLHGKVHSEREKAKAEQVVRGISGVREVRNLLQVVPENVRDTVQTSDAALKRRVEKALTEDPSLAHSSIEVESVNNGVVLLGGQAKTMGDHLRAIEDASSIPGVRRVSSEIKSPDELADAEIRQHEKTAAGHPGTEAVGQTAGDIYVTSAAKLRLLADSRTPALDISVDTNRGVVTLFGMVPSEQAKAAAQEDARKVSGVKRVVNELQVVPSSKQAAVKARDEDIQREVKRAIDSRPDLSDASISVEVKNGTARLTGTVANEQDRLAAALAARSVPSVKSVQDDLRIARR